MLLLLLLLLFLVQISGCSGGITLCCTDTKYIVNCRLCLSLFRSLTELIALLMQVFRSIYICASVLLVCRDIQESAHDRHVLLLLLFCQCYVVMLSTSLLTVRNYSI